VDRPSRLPVNGRKDGSVEELSADALHVEVHQGRRQRSRPSEKTKKSFSSSLARRSCDVWYAVNGAFLS